MSIECMDEFEEIMDQLDQHYEAVQELELQIQAIRDEAYPLIDEARLFADEYDVDFDYDIFNFFDHRG